MIRTAALIVAVAAGAAGVPPAAADMAAVGIVGLQAALDDAFNLCVAQAQGARWIGSGRTVRLETGRDPGVQQNAAPPPEVEALGNALAMRDAVRFARVPAAEGEIWMIGSAATPACFLAVADTAAAPAARVEFVRTLSRAGWKSLGTSTTPNGAMVDSFRDWSSYPRGERLILTVMGPAEARNNGTGIQLQMSLAMQAKNSGKD